MNYKLLLAVLCLCFGCTHKVSETDGSIRVKLLPTQIENTAPMSEVLSMKKKVLLETDEENLIGEISKLITTPDKYIIWDSEQMIVFVFDRNTGKKIGLIDAMGQGPQEYVTIWDITYNKTSDEIFILSPKKLLVYTPKGEFKRGESTELFGVHIALTPMGKAAVYADYSENETVDKKIKDNLLVLNADFKVEKSYMPFKTMVNSFVRINPMIGNGDSFLYYDKCTDKLYGFAPDNSLEALYTLDYGNDNAEIATKVLSDLESDKGMQPYKGVSLEKQYQYCGLNNVLNTPSYLFLIYSQNDYYYYVFYHKVDGKIRQFSKKQMGIAPPIPLINDFDEVQYYPLLSNEGDTLISYAFLPEKDTFVMIEFEIKD